MSLGTDKTCFMTKSALGDQLFAVAVGPPAKAATPSSVTPKTFRHYDQSQQLLVPPSLDDWLPEEHEARFVSEAVDDLLDLSAIYASYETADGAPPYEPRMMLKLLLYGYSIGVTSSREIERRSASSRRTPQRTTARSRAFAAGTSTRSRTCSPRCWRCARGPGS